MAAPTYKLNVKRKFKNTDGTEFWAPIGDLAIWVDKKGKPSGHMRYYASGETYHVFEAKPAPEETPVATDRPGITGQV